MIWFLWDNNLQTSIYKSIQLYVIHWLYLVQVQLSYISDLYFLLLKVLRLPVMPVFNLDILFGSLIENLTSSPIPILILKMYYSWCCFILCMYLTVYFIERVVLKVWTILLIMEIMKQRRDVHSSISTKTKSFCAR